MKNYPCRNKQIGVVLIVSLIMLLLLTIIGVTSMQVTGLEEKMAGNMRNQNLAFQSAETALRDREAWIFTRPSEPAIDSATVWALNAADPIPTNSADWWHDVNDAWWPINAVALGFTPAGIATAPRSIIEFKRFAADTLLIGAGGSIPGITYYQITSRGTGGNNQARVLLQSTTARRF